MKNLAQITENQDIITKEYLVAGYEPLLPATPLDPGTKYLNGSKQWSTIPTYTHPSTHPASMITGLPTSLPADGGNADTVGGFTVGINVPADAEFTDTVYTHPSTHSISEVSGLQAALDSKVEEPVQIKRW